jgi:hypothetical protein
MTILPILCRPTLVPLNPGLFNSDVLRAMKANGISPYLSYLALSLSLAIFINSYIYISVIIKHIRKVVHTSEIT